MKKPKRYQIVLIGILLLVLGLVLKTLFSHNVDYWVSVKYISIFLFVFGLTGISFDLILRLSKPKGSFFKQSREWIFYYLMISLYVGIIVFSIVQLERLGQSLNYLLRDHYLTSNVEFSEGEIVENRMVYIRGKTVKAYIIQFNDGDKFLRKGLLLDYYHKDNVENLNFIKFTNSGLSVQNVVGSIVKIQYSKKHPSFLRIVE